jgi:hypothetical protein
MSKNLTLRERGLDTQPETVASQLQSQATHRGARIGVGVGIGIGIEFANAYPISLHSKSTPTPIVQIITSADIHPCRLAEVIKYSRLRDPG